ncbi:MAG: hypothetical protein Ct9H300mP1_13280 [Planctomycetaceae bacterium]|nr:MAG: hypothetical protein Ct9H300mP1_13280 [Planctomycetaceae bacterium]
MFPVELAQEVQLASLHFAVVPGISQKRDDFSGARFEWLMWVPWWWLGRNALVQVNGASTG